MTPAQQRRFYFPAWQDAARRRGWLMMDGRLMADLDAPLWLPIEHPLTDLLPAIHARARELASAEHRAPQPNDLRHACHHVALGRDLSSKRMNSSQTDRVVALFRLIADPENLAPLTAWAEPDASKCRRYVRACRLLATDAYILAIARDKFCPGDFEPPFWESLRLPHLAQLLLTLRNRCAGNVRVSESARENPNA